MNIFEDLIDELKDENLLEATTIEYGQAKAESADKNVAETRISEIATATETAADAEAKVARQKALETEFYRKRAKNEVAFLQMVEYVFAGVEREQLKTVPKPFNDLQVRKLLHSFLQISHDPQSPEHAAAQFELLQETESWHSSLSLRDADVLTAHLRRFCETARPALGSPALTSLARFYRNSTFSETVRSKFDLVLTRMFSKEIDGNKRETLYPTDELSARLIELYADWSSASLYPTDAKNAKTLEIVEHFAAFVKEAETANYFDELIETSFFDRLYKFKESVNENFFAPTVAAAAVESNVRIGNRYVELLENEKAKGSAADLSYKYGFSLDQTVSETTGKTLAVSDLLNPKAAAPPAEIANTGNHVLTHEPPAAPPRRANAEPAKSTATATAATGETAPQFDKRLILLGVCAVLFVLIIYFAIG